MRGTDPPPDKETLQSFYNNILAGMQQTTKYDIYQRPFKFANGLLARNRITDEVDLAINTLLFFAVNLFTVLLCFPVKLMEHIVPPKYLEEGDTTFYTQKILVKYLNLFVSMVSLILLFIPWAHFFTFDIKKKVTRNMATVSYVILEYFIIFFASIQGYLFGAIALTTFDENSSTKSGPSIWLINGITFVLYVFTYIIWKVITSHQLTMKSGYFGTFSSPYTHIDLAVNFIIAASHPFRSSKFSTLVIVVCVIMVIYGCIRLYKSRVPYYVNFIGETIYIKGAFDYIIFGVYSIITILIGGNSHYFISIAMVLYFMSFVFATAFSSYFHSGGKDPYISTFDIQHTSTELAAISKLRYAIVNSCERVANQTFLNDIAQLRMSVDLMPDLTRICLVKGIDLSEIQIKQPTLTPLDRFSIYFLAYQVNLFLKTQLKEDDEEILDVIDELKKSTKKITEAISKFWTDADDDHRCIKDIWDIITQTNQQLNIAIMMYPQSKEIKQIRDDYYVTTLRRHSRINHIPFTTFHMLNNPIGSVLGFLNKSSKEEKVEIQDAPVERYFSDKEAYAICPVLLGAIICFVIIFVLTVFYDSYDIMFHSTLINDFDLELEIINATIALTDELLVNADMEFTQPSMETIMNTINVTTSDANDLRSKFSRRTQMPKLNNILLNTEHKDAEPISSIPGCKRISFLLNLHEGSVRKADNSTRKCYTFQLNENINGIYPSIDSHIESLRDSIKDASYTHFYVFLVIFVLITFLWWFPIYRLSREKKVMLRAVGRATAFYEHRCEYADPKTYSYYPPIVIYVIFEGLLAINFFLYFFIAYRNQSHVQSHMNQLLAIGKIGAIYQEAIALAIFTFPENSDNGTDQGFYVQLVKQCSTNISNQVDEFIKLDNIGSEEMPIIDLGVNKNKFFANVREFAQLMKEDDFEADSFQLLYSRYIAMKELSKIQSDIIPEMTAFIRRCIQETPCNYWIVSCCSVIIASLALIIAYNYVDWNRSWLRSASMVIRRAMFEDNEVVRAVLNILERKKPNYIDDFPFPVIVRRKEGAIVMCNTKLLSFTPHSKTQIVGQRVENFFGELGDTVTIKDKDGNEVTMEVEINRSGTNHEIIMFKDITELCKTKDEYTSLVNRLTPKGITLPTRGIFYNIRHRFAKPLSDEAMLALEEIEDKMGIIRIGISASTYVGIAKEYVDVKIILKFIVTVAMKIEDPTKNVIASLVKGETSVIPLVAKAIPTLCGTTTQIAAERIINGDFGVIYADKEIIEQNEFDASPFKLEHIKSIPFK